MEAMYKRGKSDTCSPSFTASDPPPPFILNRLGRRVVAPTHLEKENPLLLSPPIRFGENARRVVLLFMHAPPSLPPLNRFSRGSSRPIDAGCGRAPLAGDESADPGSVGGQEGYLQHIG